MKISTRSFPVLLATVAGVGLFANALTAARSADPPATTTAPPAAPAAQIKPATPAVAPVARPELLAAGVAAPDFTATDMDGKPVKLSDFKGKTVVIDFWASWCPPCNAAMPHNQEVMKKLQAANVPVVFLAVDNSEATKDRQRKDTTPEDRMAAFSGWVKKHPTLDALKFVYIDPKAKRVGFADYHVTGIPTQYIVDGQGIVRASFVGYGGPTDDMEKAVMAASAPAKVATIAK